MANDPIHQFHINKIIPIEFGGLDLSFTNSSLFMVLTVASVAAFPLLDDRQPRPGSGPRMQSVSEMSYEFVANMLRDARRQRRA